MTAFDSVMVSIYVLLLSRCRLRVLLVVATRHAVLSAVTILSATVACTLVLHLRVHPLLAVATL